MAKTILERAHAVAKADLTGATARHDAVAARGKALGETITALDRYIAAAEVRLGRLPSSEQVAADTALTVVANPAQYDAVNAILTAVEAARVEREKAVRDLGAMLAARKALEGAKLGLHSEATAAHRDLVAAQAATRTVAPGARDDAALLGTADTSSLGGVEKQRLAELHARAARYVEESEAA